MLTNVDIYPFYAFPLDLPVFPPNYLYDCFVDLVAGKHIDFFRDKQIMLVCFLAMGIIYFMGYCTASVNIKESISWTSLSSNAFGNDFGQFVFDKTCCITFFQKQRILNNIE